MDKLERLTNLLLVLLEAPRPMTMRELVDGVEGYPSGEAACRQAFERDKRTLREEGVPLETVTLAEGGQNIQAYRVRQEDYYLPELGLTAEEQAALNLAVAAVRLDAGSGRDALWKLGGAEHDPTPPFAALPALPALPVLHDALRTGATVRFRYREKDRAVDPYGMGFRHGFWYLVGNDRDRGEVRTFRADRIEGRVQPGEQGAFAVPEGFDLEATLPDEPWRVGEGEVVRADVLIDRVRAPLVVSELGGDAIGERRADGAVVVTMDVTNRAAFRSWVLGFLEHAEVLAPPELRAEVVEWLTSAAGPDGGGEGGSAEAGDGPS
jgi:predicted DNA-binding transcriptional regulator YafY